jgi:hypothetical protein
MPDLYNINLRLNACTKPLVLYVAKRVHSCIHTVGALRVRYIGAENKKDFVIQADLLAYLARASLMNTLAMRRAKINAIGGRACTSMPH